MRLAPLDATMHKALTSLQVAQWENAKHAWDSLKTRIHKRMRSARDDYEAGKVGYQRQDEAERKQLRPQSGH